MKVLFVNPANYLEIGIPQGIAILSAILKQHGHIVEVFDTTFLKPKNYKHVSMAGNTIYKPTAYTLEDLVKDDKVVNISKELQNKINNFKPDLIAVSVMTTNYDYAISLLKKVKISCPVIFGGVHPTLVPDEVISESVVDIVNIGEGDEALLELCNAIEQHKNITNIKNLWIKQDGKIYKNAYRKFVNLDTLPCPDWALFDERHLFRVFVGNIYKGSFYVSSRGCPGACTYCVNSTLREIFSNCGKYFRYQSPNTIVKHLTELKEKYGATWFKFGDDTFLLRPLKDLQELSNKLKPLNIQFGCSVRPNTVTEEKIKLLKEMGCVAISIGIETGNEELRCKILNRQISNKQIEDVLNIINKYNIRISAFNMIGLPEETRDNVFETIEFNKKLNVKSGNVYVVYPFPGSKIASMYKTQYRKNNKIIPMNKGSIFNLSKMSPREVNRLLKTFNLYLNLPKQLYPIIDLAGNSNKHSNVIFNALTNFTIKVNYD